MIMATLNGTIKNHNLEYLITNVPHSGIYSYQRFLGVSESPRDPSM
jgi:hypothetical protein